MATDPFLIIAPKTDPVPIVLSIPHSGTAFPSDIKSVYQKERIEELDDTDWYIDQLYDFAPAMGITIVKATYHRWVIDLNRDRTNVPLYTDGRLTTGICPVVDFRKKFLYRDERKKISSEEIERRTRLYYLPYHNTLSKTLGQLKGVFKKVLLWDCHSIRQFVPSFQNEAFPDLILGDNDNTSAHSSIINTALNALQKSDYTLQHNRPFKGGHITRYYGNPLNNVHALQLEMTKQQYMDESETTYNIYKAKKIKDMLQHTFESLIKHLTL